MDDIVLSQIQHTALLFLLARSVEDEESSVQLANALTYRYTTKERFDAFCEIYDRGWMDDDTNITEAGIHRCRLGKNMLINQVVIE